jgi:hypothetical protein
MAIIYIGMCNTPVHTTKVSYVGKDYRVHTDYYTPDGKPLRLVATRNAAAYCPPCDYKQYPDRAKPIIPAGAIVSPNVLDQGYSGHDFAIAE